MLLASLSLFALFARRAAAAVSPFVEPPAELFSPLIAKKVLATAEAFPSPAMYPQYTDRVEGKWNWVILDKWTTGFFPATLYAMHARTKLCHHSSVGDGDQWLALDARGHTGDLAHPQQHEHRARRRLSQKPGQPNCNFGGERVLRRPGGRFSEIVGCTRSWDTDDPTDFQVIIDNMMNLEICLMGRQLFFASEALTGNHTLRDMAISHADKTMANHIRPDGSSFHVVDYNSTTGVVIKQRTYQGYADNSTWSRGQEWGIYGFATMYKHTQKYDYIQTARRMSDYFLDNLPDDGVVPWDFNAPLDPPRPADSSAAMIAANGLLLLANRRPPSSTPLALRATPTLPSRLAWAPTWQSLLSNGTVNTPKQNTLTGMVYGMQSSVVLPAELLTNCLAGRRRLLFITAGNTLVEKGLASC
ncbi:glycoside hydrolase family 88 protein [Epithele typhae]|uniref:glycoside hydrolase family 88 protein n=1 Tax=Epithele typhae TaxID=378194 RepID=UPI0020073A09|nr:glycoside hydrolase family 88 protein [Epithele typhae]KAH9915796.1 glycoside hydrolase family 88 protein [Epithele typhae]